MSYDMPAVYREQAESIKGIIPFPCSLIGIKIILVETFCIEEVDKAYICVRSQAAVRERGGRSQDAEARGGDWGQMLITPAEHVHLSSGHVVN